MEICTGDVRTCRDCQQLYRIGSDGKVGVCLVCGGEHWPWEQHAESYRAPVVRHWCGRAERHEPHIGCNGFGMLAGPGGGCGRTVQHPAHRSCDGLGATAGQAR